MIFTKSTLFAAVALVGLASAQSYTSSSAAPQGSVKAHVVMVSNANGSLTFSPDTVNAGRGEMVQFQFYPMNHSVAQSTFDSPCQPTNGSEGFWSGFMPVTSKSSSMPVFSVAIKNTDPMWFYCATGKHCQAGMVGVINPPTSGAKTLAAYKLAAASVTKSGIPNSAAGTGGKSNTTTGTPTSGSGGAISTSNGSLPSVPTSTGTNSGSALVASSTFILLAAGFSALFAY